MITISIPDKDLDILIRYYETELSKAEVRLTEISGILQRLRPASETEKTVNQKNTEKAKAPSIIKTTKEEPTANDVEIDQIDFSSFLRKLLENEKRVMNNSEFTDSIAQAFNISEEEKFNIARKLAPVVNQLVKVGILRRIKEGRISSYFYGFSGWFDEAGNLKPEFSYENKKQQPVEKELIEEKKTQPEAKKVRGRQEVEKVQEQKKAPRRRGKNIHQTKEASNILAKINYSDLIFTVIKKYGRVVNNSEITEYAVEEYKVGEDDRYELSRLILKELVKVYRAGSLGRTSVRGNYTFYYGLLEWFDSKGVLEQYNLLKVDKRYKKPNVEENKTSTATPVAQNNKEEKTNQQPSNSNIDEEGDEDEDVNTEAISKINISDFIINSLRKQKQELMLEDFLDIAKEQYDFKRAERRVFSNRISDSFLDLFRNKQIKRIAIRGTNQYTYALPEWFMGDGVLIESYKNKNY